jgi:diguanylate cyclase (GGDEF)-like protein
LTTLSPKNLRQRKALAKLGKVNLLGVGLGLALLVGLVLILDSGPLVDWVLLLLLAITFLALRRAFTLPAKDANSADEDEAQLRATSVKQRFWRDLIVLALLLGCAAILVFLFDSGSLVEWLARHKSTKIDEIIVAAVVLLVGLSFFSVRRSVELRQHLEAYEVLHEQTARLNRESAILSELNDLLQSCLSAAEAYPIIASRAQMLLPGRSGEIAIIANSRNLVETYSSWGPHAPRDQAFAPQDCWALRKGRFHVSKRNDPELSCGHLSNSESAVTLCMPMMAHGETLGLLCIAANTSARPTEGEEFPEIRLIRALSEHASLAIANLKLREVLRSQSVRDPLTNLYNRRYMEEFLDGQLARATRKSSSLALMMLDVDHFKQFNDSFGHDAGDMVLRNLANLLLSHLRREDVVCRYGGEEFTVILPDASRESASLRAEQLRAAVKDIELDFRGQALPPISISVGLAVFPVDGTTREMLLKSADTALYKAKANGRDCVVLASV